MGSLQEELARVHKEIQEINNTLKHCHIGGDGESVIVYQDILNVIDTLETLETRLHTLASGDCQFVHHLPEPAASLEL